MNFIAILGYLAALASMASFVPQAWKVIHSRETKDISAGMYLLTVSAFALWLAYGVLQRQWPLVISNGVCLLLSAFILAMTLLPKAEKDKIADTVSGKEL
jgi:MtN3 and saliva related transmembrane protein